MTRAPACAALASHSFVRRIPRLPPVPAGDCFTICAALAEGIPGRVVQELLSLCGISPALAAAAAAGQAAELPLLGRVLAAEGAAGRYPATQAFLRLLTTLVSGGLAGGSVPGGGRVGGIWRVVRST